MPEVHSSQTPTFAELLEDLFERRRRPDGNRYTLRDIATAMSGEIEPYSVSHQYLSRLLNGVDQNPTIRVVEALCLVFEVPPEYFFPRLHGRTYKNLPPRS